MKKGFISSLLTTIAWAGISLGQDLPALSRPVGSTSAPATSAIPSLAEMAQPAVAPSATGLPSAAGAACGASCGSNSCCAANACGASSCFSGCCGYDPWCNRVYFGADYLLWWVKAGPMPLELVTTGPSTGGLDGAIGTPGTTSLFGPTNMHFGTFSGMRYTAGYWFDEMCGIEATGFLLETRTSAFNATSNGSQVIAMPVTDAATGKDIRFTVADPTLRSGAVDVVSSTQLFGAELNGLVNLYQASNFRVTGLYGFRWVELNESTVIASNSTALTNGMGDDDVIFNGRPLSNAANTVVDSFSTRNSFYGFNLGARGEWYFGDLFIAACAKVAIGDSHEVIDNFGFTTATGPAGGYYPYGRFVGPSNSGTFSRDQFAVVPEAELKIGYQLTRYLKGYVGYNFMYWSNVVRPGDQISQTVDLRGTSTAESPPHSFMPGFTGTTAPGVPFTSTNFWAQGLSFGLIFSY